MTKPTENQHTNSLFADFLRKVGSWLYTHADTIDTYAKNIIDVIILFIGLLVAYGFLLLGGAV